MIYEDELQEIEEWDDFEEEEDIKEQQKDEKKISKKQAKQEYAALNVLQDFLNALLLNDDNEEHIRQAEENQLKAIKTAELYARKGVKEAQNFIISVIQQEELAVSQNVLETAKNAIVQFFGYYIYSECSKRCTIRYPTESANNSFMKSLVDDCVNESWNEIFNEISKFDCNIAQFSTWSQSRIMSGIANAVAFSKGRRSKTTMQIDKKIANARKELIEEGFENPNEGQIARKAKQSLEQVKRSLHRMEHENKQVSLDEDFNDNKIDLDNNEISEDFLSPEQIMLERERTQNLIYAWNELTKIEQHIFSALNGVYVEDNVIQSSIEKPPSVKQLSEEMCISESDIYTYQQKALRKLQNNYREINQEEKKADMFLHNQRMSFAKSKEDEDMLLIINSIEDIIDIADMKDTGK